MDIRNLLENEKHGLYVACNFSKQTIKTFKDIAKSLNVTIDYPNKLHTTIIYSKRPPNKFIKFDMKQRIDEVADVIGLDVFKTQDDKFALVVKLKSNYLSDKHKWYMQEYNLSYDYENYHPHVTLTYDFNDETVPKLDSAFKGSIVLSQLYHEPLSLKWDGK